MYFSARNGQLFLAPATEEDLGEGEPSGGFGTAGSGLVPEIDLDAVGKLVEHAAADLADQRIGESGGAGERAGED